MVRMLGIEFGGNTNICDLQVCITNFASIIQLNVDYIISLVLQKKYYYNLSCFINRALPH